jgi:carboxypeptidase T
MHPFRGWLLACALAACVASGARGQGVASEIHVFVPDHAALLELIALDLDLIPHQADPGWVPVIVYGPDQLAALSGAGFQYQVVHPDLVAHYAAGLVQVPEASFPNGSMGGYFTWAEMVAEFDALVAAHPTLIAPKQSIGTSHEGRPLWMWKISDNPLANESEPEVLLDSLHHAREPGGMMSLYWFVKTILEGYPTVSEYASLINHREIFVVPCVNPDGYVYNETTNPGGGGLWRKNRRNNGNGSFGVDLNRNYSYLWGYDNVGSSPTPSSETYRGPSPASEPEIQALVALAQAHPFTVIESVHTSGGFHLFPFGHLLTAVSPMAPAYLEWAARMSVLSGYRAGTVPQILYTTNGSARDWWEATYGIPAMTTEMGHENDGFWPPTSRILPIALDNFPTFYEWSWVGGSHVVVDSVVLHQVTGNGNPWPEAAETFDVEVVLRNVGSLATAAAVPASAQATTPYAQLIVASSSTPAALASRTNGSVTFRIAVAPSVPRAAPLSLLVSWTFDGVARQDEVRLTAGPLVTIATDTFEAASAWTVGSPTDTGAGAWTRVNPNGTALGLVAGGTTPWQTEDDHTAAGTQCWVTGNGSVGGSVSAADVDGQTTLTSPAYDLGAVLQPEVSAWIWYANDDEDDPFFVEASNDDGATWVSLGTVLGWKNAWTNHVWRLSDFLMPTSRTRVRFVARDLPSNSVTEAAIDDFEIRGYQPRLTLGAVTTGQPVPFSLSSSPAMPGAVYAIGVSTSALSGIALGDGRVAGIDATPALDLVFAFPQIFVNFLGALGPAGSSSALLAISDPGLSGLTFFATAVTYQPGPPFVPGEITGTLFITVP